MRELKTFIHALATILIEKKLKLVTAESCTGGEVAYLLTSIPDSSVWFDRGYVTYSNQAKQDMLGVSATILNECGAVSEETAQAMALGALVQSGADLSLAITGIAGPGGGTTDKPVGTVWIAWARKENQCLSECFYFSGDRVAIRHEASKTAIIKLLEKDFLAKLSV